MVVHRPVETAPLFGKFSRSHQTEPLLEVELRSGDGDYRSTDVVNYRQCRQEQQNGGTRQGEEETYMLEPQRL
jgi:hypothetical protein